MTTVLPVESGDICAKVASVDCWVFLYKMTLCTPREPPGISYTFFAYKSWLAKCGVDGFQKG